MSTRSVIATTTHPEGWHGRYCHYDGYPSHMGETLWAIIHRDGPEEAIKTLIMDNTSWSSLNQYQPDLAGVTPDIKANYDTLEFEAATISVSNCTNVPGYGVAHPKTDNWYTDNDELDFIEYLYVIEAHQITIHDLNEQTTITVDLAGEQPDWMQLEKDLHTEKVPS